MKPQTFEPGVVQEPATSLTPNLEAYWKQNGKTYDRVLSIGDSVEDGEISWTQARVQQYQEVQRTIFQRLMKSEIDGSINHPSGKEVVAAGGATRRGHLFSSLREGIDLQSEIARRLPVEVSKIIRISDQKLFMEGGVPVRTSIRSREDAFLTLSDTPLPVPQVEAVYKSTLRSLPDAIAKKSSRLSAEDVTRLYELDAFRKDRVRWARVTSDGMMMADEAGKIGDAWIFIVPPGHPMMETQKSVHSMNYDSTGLNPYLSILPYDMTDRWAALGAVHELSHLRDAVLGIEPREGRTRDQYLEGEHRAYSVERALAFAYSDGRLQTALESIVRGALSKAGDPTAALNSLVNEQLAGISQSLDLCLEPQAPRSRGEQGVRQGLYMMLIGFEVARQLSGGDPARVKQIEKSFIELIYEPMGILPQK